MDLFALFGIFLLVLTLGILTLVEARAERKKLLILDLNGVLVFRDKEKHIDYKRENVETFLDWCFENFDVALWSSARKHNVEHIAKEVMGAERIKRLRFMWHQDQCTPHPTVEYVFKKPLQKVWDIYGPQYDQTNTLIMDDTAEKMEDNPPNTWFPVKTWKGDDDNEVETLKQLEERLWKLK